MTLRAAEIILRVNGPSKVACDAAAEALLDTGAARVKRQSFSEDHVSRSNQRRAGTTKPHVASNGLAHPDDLALLKKVYDRICAEQGIPAGCAEAADLAGTAMDLFRRGVFDEETLYRELRRSWSVSLLP